MATRNQVLSLFGASPEQILEQRRREQAADILKQQDPFARAGSAIGVGLARMFGGEPAEVTQQRELYGMLNQINLEDPEQLRSAATTLKDRFPDKALQLLMLANERETQMSSLETDDARQALAEAQAAEIKAKGDIVEVPVLTTKTTTDTFGNVLQAPSITTIKVPASEAERYRTDFDSKYKALTGTTPPPDLGTKNEKGTLVGTRYVDGKPVYIFEKEGTTTAYTADGTVFETQQTQTQSNKAPIPPAVQEQRLRLQNQSIAPKAMPGTSAEDQTNPFGL
jgi:hypothetical protein